MIRIKFRLRGDWRVAAVAVCVLMLLPLAGSVAALDSESATAAITEPSAVWLPDTAGRHYYLSAASYSTTSARSSCATGYHMASLWEILDVSNLVYDNNHPAAETKTDSGYGPPSNWYGWVRTGQDSSGSSTVGVGNCKAWTSNSSSDYGVSVRLSRTWVTAPGDIATWDAKSFTCNYLGPVWCVANVHSTWLPGIRKVR